MMDWAATLSTVLTAISTLIKVFPTIQQTASDLKVFGEALATELTGGSLTEDQRAAISAGIDALFARLEEPLPPAQPGDPDYQA